MKTNAFIGLTRTPTEKQLAEALGPARPAWDGLLDGVARAHGLTPAWKSYSIKMGWVLQLKQKQRNIVHLGPCRGSFQTLIIFGDKAMAVVREIGWPQRIRKIINEAPRYPEGTGVRLQIKKAKDIDVVKKLAAIKMDH